MTDRTGEILAGRYRIIRELGSGGMGTVYLAEHIYLGRPTAVKRLRPELAQLPDAEQRFRREALLAARINHPSVAQIYDFDCTVDGEFLLAMEYVEGETLAQRIRREGRFALPIALKVLQASAEGLDRAHSLGIVHRDIKPENLMLGAEGVVKLLDFGVARPIETGDVSVTSAGMVVGTLAYMSPEQLTGEAVGPASDQYSLAIVTYQMLCGRLPHEARSFDSLRLERLTLPAPLLHLLRDECSPALSEVIARALDPEPAARWPSATAFARAVRAALELPLGASGSHEAFVMAPDAQPLDRWAAHVEALRLAGREREVRQVRDAWAAARAARAPLLWIEGEEGLGKSAFLDLAQREAAGDGAGILSGQGYEADIVRPYGVWLSILRTALTFRAARDRPWPAIEALVTQGGDASMSPRAALFDEVALLLRRAAELGPLFIGIEDLEWCDAASVSLMEFLAHDLCDVRVMIAVTAITGNARGEGEVRDVRERLRRIDNVVWITLRPLGYEAVSGWINRVLGRDAPEELVRYVYGHTEGNAFFIEQVMRGLLERGELARASDAQMRMALADETPPAAVTDVVQRRLQGMSDAAREVLQIAAVAGREFDVDLVLTLATHGEDAVLDALDEAVTAGVLTPVTRGDDDWYRFTHGKIAEVLAQSMNARRRRKLHARIADLMLAEPNAPPGPLAWHWYRAGDFPRASGAARAAARAALQVHDCDDALTFGLLAARTAQSPLEQREAHELRGDALRGLDRHAEAAAAYAHARLAGQPDEESAVRLRSQELRCALAAGTVSASAVVEEARKLVDRAQALTMAVRGGAQLLHAEALLAAGDGNGAHASAERARGALLEAGRRSDAGDAMLVAGAASLRQGELSTGQTSAREAQALFSELGDAYGAARAFQLCGALAAAGADRPAALAAFDDALRQAERAHVTRMVRQIRERISEMGT